METVLKADIFFIIASAGVVIGTLAIVVAAYFVARAAIAIRQLATRGQEEFEWMAHQAHTVRRSFLFPVKFVQRFFTQLSRQWNL